MYLAFTLLAVIGLMPQSASKTEKPLFRTVDLNVGDIREVELSDGSKAKVKLLEIKEIRDGLRSAIRQSQVKVEVNGKMITLVSAKIGRAHV